MTPVLIIHGGAGAASAPDVRDGRRRGLERAFEAGWGLLCDSGTALDAVVQAVVVLENDPLFNAGVGSVLTETGTVEMDASVMDGTTFRTGAVGAVANVPNPVQLARVILETERHVLLVGSGAERFAREHDFPIVAQRVLVTARQHARWQALTQGESGTVGAAALDHHGNLVVATSTGGTVGKLPGRVGDSAVIGAGTYADTTLGACSATGDGEAIMRVGLARTAVELLRGGTHPQAAARVALDSLQRITGGKAGLILIDRLGRLGCACTTPAMGTVHPIEGRPAVRV